MGVVEGQWRAGRVSGREKAVRGGGQRRDEERGRKRVEKVVGKRHIITVLFDHLNYKKKLYKDRMIHKSELQKSTG